MRILYLAATPVPPDKDVQRDRFYLLSSNFEGDILHPLWWDRPEAVKKYYGDDAYPVRTAATFRYHWFLAFGRKGLLRKLQLIWFYLSRGLQIHREKPVECIVVYSHMTTGLCGAVLKLLTGAKLVIEIATSPAHVYLAESRNPTIAHRLMFLYSEFCLHVSVLMADRIHLLAPDLLSRYRFLRHRAKSVFHDFVTVRSVPAKARVGNPYILLVGAPWYLKGADLLVDAFVGLMADFPEVRLRLLGHYPDRAALDAQIAGNERIEILKAVPNPEALDLIAGASVLVLPSRCEGMGRVLIEAMAAGVPVVGSDVGGIPHMVRDGENGFIFPRGDARALEQKLRILLANPELAAEMGRRGREMAEQEFTEERYVEHFAAMVEDAVLGKQ